MEAPLRATQIQRESVCSSAVFFARDARLRDRITLPACFRASHGDPLHRLRRSPSPTSGFYLEWFRCLRLSPWNGPFMIRTPSPNSRRRRSRIPVDGTELQERDPWLRHSRKCLPCRGGGPPQVAEGVPRSARGQHGSAIVRQANTAGSKHFHAISLQQQRAKTTE